MKNCGKLDEKAKRSNNTKEKLKRKRKKTGEHLNNVTACECKVDKKKKN